MLASCSWHRHWVACNSNTTSFFAIQIALVDVDLFKFNSIPICHVLGFPKLLNLGSGLKGVLDHIGTLSKKNYGIIWEFFPYRGGGGGSSQFPKLL